MASTWGQARGGIPQASMTGGTHESRLPVVSRVHPADISSSGDSSAGSTIGERAPLGALVSMMTLHVLSRAAAFLPAADAAAARFAAFSSALARAARSLVSFFSSPITASFSCAAFSTSAFATLAALRAAASSLALSCASDNGGDLAAFEPPVDLRRAARSLAYQSPESSGPVRTAAAGELVKAEQDVGGHTAAGVAPEMAATPASPPGVAAPPWVVGAGVEAAGVEAVNSP